MTATRRGVRGVILDLDGTVYENDRLIPGAAETVDALRAAGVGLRFATNTTRRPRQALVERLDRLGIRIEAGELFTAPVAAAAWLRARRLRRVALHIAEATWVDFSDVDIVEDGPDAVVVGDLGSDWTFERLNLAFRQLLAGAALVAIQKNRYWKTEAGLTLDAGPFVAALEYATGNEATLVGKPSAAFFEGAARALDLPIADVAVVGDDISTDVAGAMAIGAQGVLVKTGKFRAQDLEDPTVRPDAVVDSIATLPSALGL